MGRYECNCGYDCDCRSGSDIAFGAMGWLIIEIGLVSLLVATFFDWDWGAAVIIGIIGLFLLFTFKHIMIIGLSTMWGFIGYSFGPGEGMIKGFILAFLISIVAHYLCIAIATSDD